MSLILAWLKSGPLGALAGVGAAIVAGLAALFMARQSGKNAERADNLADTAEIKDAQQKAAADGPRTGDDAAQRMRDGSF